MEINHFGEQQCYQYVSVKDLNNNISGNHIGKMGTKPPLKVADRCHRQNHYDSADVRDKD